MEASIVQSVLKDKIIAGNAAPVDFYALADLLAENDQDKLAFAYRWCSHHGKRPGFRDRKRVRCPWTWWWAGWNFLPGNLDGQAAAKQLYAHLDQIIFKIHGVWNAQTVFETFDEAMDWLADRLDQIRMVLEPPK